MILNTKKGFNTLIYPVAHRRFPFEEEMNTGETVPIKASFKYHPA